MSSNLETSIPQEVGDPYSEVPCVAPEERIAQADLAPAVLGSPSGLPMRLCYFVGDLLSICAGIVVGKILASWIAGTWWQPLSALELKFFGMFSLGMVAVAAWSGCYTAVPSRPARQFRTWSIGTMTVSGASVLSSWLFGLNAAAIVPAILIAATFTHLTACFVRALCRISFGAKNWWGTRILVVGSNPSARDAMRYLVDEPQWGLRPVGYLTEDERADQLELNLTCLGTLKQLDEAARQTGVRRALVALHPFDLKEMREHFSRPDAAIRHWIVIPCSDYFNVLWSEWNETARMPAVTVSNSLALPRARFLKRAFDLVLTSLISLALLPLIAIISLLVRLTSEGPVFYKHRRIGKDGEPFEAWKFRTMVRDADETLARYFEQYPELREEWQNSHKLKHDPRITAVGRFLRATSLDELPQLWNVLMGEMSLVGPRPIVTSEANKYRTLFGHYQQVRPGITGLWQVSGRNDTTYKERIDLDVYYVENWSIWLDLYILACTIKVVLLREGAY